MSKNYELRYLTNAFFEKYDFKRFPEIEQKENRPYMVLLVKIKENTFAIPFRTNINHKSAYRFKSSGRDTKNSTGLDYTKAVVVNDCSYIGETATIDDKEFLELNKKYFFITKQFSSYVNGYYKYLRGELNPYRANTYKYSTLKYFHNELGIQ